MSDFQFEKDQIPLWQYLGLTDSYSAEDVLLAYESMTDKQKQNEQIILAWKLLSDPMYAEAYRTYQSVTALVQAGFFVDPYPNKIRYEVDFLSTPYDKVREAILKQGSSEKPYIVVLTTGSFSPIHMGHMFLMEAAKKTMEDQGYTVVGGYISPSHDGYVSTKDGGRAAMHVEKRSYLIETLIKEFDWLYLDKWEGYYNQYPINFTDVIFRLEAYLNKHIPTDAGIKVCYVFGGDNAAFGRAFLTDHYAVCVHRSGSEKKFKAVHDELSSLSNVFFVEENHLKGVSSTSIRNGSVDGLQDEIEDLYRRMLIDEDQGFRGTYAIRNDLEFAFPLPDNVSKRVVNEVSKAVESAFDKTINVEVISWENQKTEVNRLTNECQLPTISIDAFIRGNFNLDTSRLFELGTMQFNSKGITNRPFTPSLEEQVEAIPPGEYLLIEDDVASGYTLKKVSELLSQRVTIKDLLILSSLEGGTNNKGYFDIIDMRDFLFGSVNSGLVTTLPNGERIRVPYVLPYVSPMSRASVPTGKELEFSIQIWEINREFYRKHPRSLEQMDPSLVALMRYIGFDEGVSMLDIMNWHIAQLKGEFSTCQNIRLHHGQQKEPLLQKVMALRSDKTDQERRLPKGGKRLMSNMKQMLDSLPLHQIS